MKKVIYYIITALIPVLFFVGLEGVLRLLNVGESSQPLVIEAPIAKEYYTLNPRVAERYFDEDQFATAPQLKYFSKIKSDSIVRIVVQGASSSAGFPYRNASFPKLLEQKLSFAFPDKKIEVINTSIVATNSYTWLDLTSEIIALKPDLILVYGGHNEYYGALGVASSQSKGSNPAMVNLYLRLKNFRTVQLMSELISKGTQKAASDKSNSETLMARMVKEPEIQYNSELYSNGLNQYSHNMSRLLEKYKAASIPVMISNLVSNLKDFKPFSSGTGHESAQSLFNQANEEFANGNYDRAKELYVRSKDKDLLRFRASSQLDSIIFELARLKDAQFIDVKKVFQISSPQGIIGNELLHEHVHPNLNGQRLLANTFFNHVKDYLIRTEDLDAKNDFSSFNFAIAPVDSTYADILIQQMMPNWPFLRGDSTSITQGKITAVLSGAVSWYQVLLDSYYVQLSGEPEKAILTARVYLQDFPNDPQAYKMLLDAYLANSDFKNAKDLFDIMPADFKDEASYLSFIQANIRASDYKEASHYVSELKEIFPNYRLYDRQIGFLNSIMHFIDLDDAYSLWNKNSLLDALEAFIFFDKIEAAKEIIKLYPVGLKSDSRFVSLKRRFTQK